MNNIDRLLQSLELLRALEPRRAIDPVFRRAWEVALEDAKSAARDFISEVPTSPAAPSAKRSSEPPPR
jgi:hypothetical protein